MPLTTFCFPPQAGFTLGNVVGMYLAQNYDVSFCMRRTSVVFQLNRPPSHKRFTSSVAYKYIADCCRCVLDYCRVISSIDSLPICRRNCFIKVPAGMKDESRGDDASTTPHLGNADRLICIGFFLLSQVPNIAKKIEAFKKDVEAKKKPPE